MGATAAPGGAFRRGRSIPGGVDGAGEFPDFRRIGEGERLRGQLAANSRESLNFLKQARQAGLSRVAVWPVPQM